MALFGFSGEEKMGFGLKVSGLDGGGGRGGGLPETRRA